MPLRNAVLGSNEGVAAGMNGLFHQHGSPPTTLSFSVGGDCGVREELDLFGEKVSQPIS